MKKRSIIISGHSTSVTLEDEFWDALSDIAREKECSLSALISAIDAKKNTANLSSATRLFILENLQHKIKGLL